MQQQIERLQMRLTDKSAALELKARDWNIQEEKINVGARAAAEKPAMAHIV
ncbi:MAG: hypothetical protein ABI865_11215 [Nitrosospira sp.]